MALLKVPMGFCRQRGGPSEVGTGKSIAAIEWICLHMEQLSTFVFAFCMVLLGVDFPNTMPKCFIFCIFKAFGESFWTSKSVRYKDNLPLVLHDLTCKFPGGKKVGIVGHLWSRLTIIPQDPSLFEGTIRGNLDPLEEHTDEEIWQALDKSQLGALIRWRDQKLDSPGRALLKQARILVLDEATASVDTATDNLIQRIIRSEFRDCRVLTIAHRIPTIMDSDLVLVLSDGRVAEFDSPARLMDGRLSIFMMLVGEYTSRSSGNREFRSSTCKLFWSDEISSKGLPRTHRCCSALLLEAAALSHLKIGEWGHWDAPWYTDYVLYEGRSFLSLGDDGIILLHVRLYIWEFMHSECGTRVDLGEFGYTFEFVGFSDFCDRILGSMWSGL
ncbi:Multidrug resistance-associated protein 5 [Ancistrocladus abbreviatus]